MMRVLGIYLALIFSLNLQAQTVDKTPLAKGKRLPSLRVYTQVGKKVDLRKTIEGKVAVIDFWHTYCGPCIKSIPRSVGLMEKYSGRNDLVFVFVSLDDPRRKATWLGYVKNDYKNLGIHLNSPEYWESKVVKKYDLNYVPRVIVVGKDGIITESHSVMQEEEIVPIIEEALRQ
jgi:thiol-disulfide isomerase/thioredoxin